MKRHRALLLGLVTVAILAVVLLWSPSAERGFDTPEKCVNAFYKAAMKNRSEGIVPCLADHLRADAPVLVKDKTTIEALVQQSEALVTGTLAEITMDEVRKDGTQRVTYQLEKKGGGWHIVAISAPKEVETNVEYGTPMNEVPDP